jgi:hypothetical protein
MHLAQNFQPCIRIQLDLVPAFPEMTCPAAAVAELGNVNSRVIRPQQSMIHPGHISFSGHSNRVFEFSELDLLIHQGFRCPGTATCGKR